MFRFAYPLALLLALIVPAVLYMMLRRRRERSVAYSSIELFIGAGLEASVWKRYGRAALRTIILLLVVAGIARPQTGRSEYKTHTEGIDIMLVLDASGSMQAQDFKPKDRLHVAKEVMKEFIEGRKHDRIGLVAFAAQAVTQCPLTLDYPLLMKLVEEVDIGMLEDGTAIGVALATAVNRLKNSQASSRVAILLTDGQNNAGAIDPVTAAKVAASLGIKVYAIGVGTKGRAPMPVDDPVFGRRFVSVQVDLDEETLIGIARLTDGLYFRATNREELVEIYKEIDEMEKTKIESETWVSYTERFPWFIIPALGILLVELALAQTALRELP
ncbi:MAG: VWA domain-containing protein [Candidatus Krumholzibacteriota bacterium]|nr:VWA domain-containing protein [Candidatus Krumholzibacteriota bacterium]